MDIKERATAVHIITQLDPEEGLDDYIDSIPCGCTGEYEAQWNEEKLKKLFSVNDEYENSPLAKLTAAADTEYWKMQGNKLEHDNLKTLVTRLIKEIDSGGVDMEGHTLMAIRTYCKD